MTISEDSGNTAPDWLTAAQKHLWLPYTQMKTVAPPLPAAATEGARIILSDGRELVDGIASWWTACHGYNHPHIRTEVEAQLERLPHVMLGGLVTEPAARLAQRLAALTPGDLDHVFFSESGSVSVEIGMKMAIQYWINQGKRGRRKFVCFRYGYHGDTLGTMSVCDPDEGMHTLFRGALLEQFLVDVPRSGDDLHTLDAFLRTHRDEIAAVIIEPLVQGAGGMKFHPPEVLAGIAALCDKHGHLLILDEIFTGFGRTGTMFACQQAGIVPDIMTLSKALTGGTMALAATIARAHIYDAFLSEDEGAALMHGPTFMGNPLACAAANASLDLFAREPRLQAVERIEGHLRTALAPCREIEGVVDVRTLGAIGVIELAAMRDIAWLKQRFIEQGVWLRPFGDIIYTTPPLTITEAELTRITDAMVATTREWAAR